MAEQAGFDLDLKLDIKKIVAKDAGAVDEFLLGSGYLCDGDSEKYKVIDAERYAVSAGGKRIRPILCMEFYKLFGGTSDITAIAACLELMHTFSLIHDDMPEMDNDSMRRGKPSVHCAYGSDIALLAGDGLCILPFEIISDKAASGEISSEKAVKLISCLSKAIGNNGMIIGQALDIYSEGMHCDEGFLITMSNLKTGCMLCASAEFGAILAGADEERTLKAREYAKNLGLAFQIVDDILDVTSCAEILGKPIGSDMKRDKDTFVDVFGIDGAYEEARKYTERAVSAISDISGSEFLVGLAYMLIDRIH